MPIPNTNEYFPIPEAGFTAILAEKGGVFLVDHADVEIARQHCWSLHVHGYARAVTRVNGKLKTVYLHRLIAAVGSSHVDHQNGDVTDCRRVNLRPCTRHQNLRNQRIRIDNRTGFKNVGLHKQTGKYRARVRAGSVCKTELFETLEDAVKAAESFRTELHKEFARDA